MLSVRCLPICLLLLGTQGRHITAGEFKEVRVAGKRVTVYAVDPRNERLQLFLRDRAGQPLKSFEAVDRHLASQGDRLAFAMNAGMYHRDSSPVGLFVANGKQVAPLNTNNGYGNFHMKPNGVFPMTTNGAHVIESSQYTNFQKAVVLASQSGPLLVHAGKLHPQFNTNSTSRLIRNGVGVTASGKVFFAITEEPVNLYEFAVLFRDLLACPSALYFDGVISSLHAPPLKRSDKRAELGPIIAVVESRR